MMVSVRVVAAIVSVCACDCSDAFCFSEETAVAGGDGQLWLLWRLREQGHGFMASGATHW